MMLDSRTKFNALIVFFFLSIFTSWLFWIPLALKMVDINPFFHLLGTLGPLFAFIITSTCYEGFSETVRSFKSLTRFYPDIKPYLLSIIFTSLPVFLGMIALKYIPKPGLDSIYVDKENFILVFIVTLIVLPFEELSWRGYFYPKLQSFTSPIPASIILSILWSIRQFPLVFYVPVAVVPYWNFYNIFIYFISYSIANTFLTLFMTWIYNYSNGNIPLMVLCHCLYSASISSFKMRYTIGFISISIMQTLLFAYIYTICPKYWYDDEIKRKKNYTNKRSTFI